MPAGRPRKSIGQHKADGTYRPARHQGRLDAEPLPAKLLRPRGLTKEQRWLWDTIVEGLPKDLLGKIDTPALLAACHLWSVWITFKDETNGQRYYKALASLKQLNVLLSRFGWTPADREKLRVSTQRQESDDDRFFGLCG